ncbi:laminin subunit alpha-3 isoform X2 [Cololabis saira]|uniref:laminin subunit alpha-3 isoform X2 n=1 Tax=Cololabis saira TaxID=129043 RepID=UPI002AD43906|nr:laminin subunit alpha-3 isoform X2 [Cololabis saira]
MKWNIMFYVSVWMVWIYFAPICHTSQKHLKHWHDGQARIHQKRQSTKRLCHTFKNQTAVGTQKCSSGFYREWAGSYKARCVPCSCNGLSNECDERTGSCLNCLFDTTGDRCERCKEGYYGNPANRTCRACPCPFRQNNFALACMETSSGEVECLCKQGYIGARCERCAFGYYGNPGVHGGTCKRCNCKDNSSACDSVTGECITCHDSSCVNCRERDSCSSSLLGDLEEMDAGLARLKLHNISHNNSASWTRLSRLQENISSAVLQVQVHTAGIYLDLVAGQLEADVLLVRNDLSQLRDKTLNLTSGVEKVWSFANGVEVQELLSEVEGLLSAVQRQQTEMELEESGSVSETDRGKMMEEAHQSVQEAREHDCTTPRDQARREQEGAHRLLNLIRHNVRGPAETLRASLHQTTDSLMASASSVREAAELLLSARDAVNRTMDLNLKSFTLLRHLQRVAAQLETEQRRLHSSTSMTRDLLNNITGAFATLREIKEEYENHAAQLDGAKRELFKRSNNFFQSLVKMDAVTKAEEHTEELNSVASELQQALHNANSTELLRIQGVASHSSLVTALETAELAANQSRVAADQTLKDAKEEGLFISAGEMKDNSSYLCTEANDTRDQFKMLSRAVDTRKDSVNERMEQQESLKVNISAVGDDVKKIKRDDVEIMTESAKKAASAVNSRVSDVKERLRNISLELERKTPTNVSVNINHLLSDAQQALKNFNRKLPVLSNKLEQMSALTKQTSPTANMMESIRRIKDLIDETRSFVNRLSIATTFNGRGHIELHPPRNLDDIKAFTAVDLLLNRHQAKPSESDGRLKRRRRHRDADLFVFYLGDKNSSGDYIGMAVRNTVLICVYKLGGVVHEVESGHITTTTVNSSDFDRVVFHRVYQDAEVNLTQHFTSQKPFSLPPKRHLPNTTSGVLSLDPDTVVFYVGGYPEDFTPPEELHYPKYRGAMRLSYINDKPVCLFNYKHAVNMGVKQPAVKIPQTEVSDYYQGTGYRMAYVKEPGKKKRRLIKFHTKSRETDALLFCIGSEESFWCLFVERGLLVLQGQQENRKLRVESPDRISLFDKQFAIIIAKTFSVYYGSKQISADHIQTNYARYYIGGLPAELRQRHNVNAPPLRGCVAHVTEDAEITEYKRTVGVSRGCPLSLLGVRAATLYSALSVDSLFVRHGHPERVSLGFRSTDRHAVLLQTSSQGSTSAPDLQLSLIDGCILFQNYNYSLMSDQRYNDGVWHYVSAVGRPAGLELSVDNVNVIQRQSPHIRRKGGKFRSCVADIYVRPGDTFTPADLSVLSHMADVLPGQCSLHPSTHSELLPADMQGTQQVHKPTPEGGWCRRLQSGSEYRLTAADSWLSYTLPQQDLNHRPHFSLDIKTESSKGLIFHAAGRGAVPVLALYMANGKIRLSLGHSRVIQHRQRSNDGNWHRVKFSVEKSYFHLLIDGFRVTDGHLPGNEGSSLQLHNPVYLGGDPKRRSTKVHDIPMDSIIGCIRDLKMNEVAVSEPDSSHKTLPCSGGLTEMGTYFGGGHVVLDPFFALGSYFVLSFEVRPQHPEGLLFHFQRDNQSSLNVYLMENKVGVMLDDGAVSVSVMPHKSLCDGKFHAVTVSRNYAVVKLEVDSTYEETAASLASNSDSAAQHSLYVGGKTDQHGVAVSLPFVGCLKNVRFNGRPVVFGTESRVVGLVSIHRCPSQ